MKKQVFIFFVVAQFFAAVSFAEVPVVTGYSRILSQYVNDVGVVFYDNSVVQSDISALWKKGIYVGLWHSTGLKKLNAENSGAEVDLYAGWAGRANGIGINIGTAYFDLAPMWKLQKNDIIQTHIELSKKFNVVEGQAIVSIARVEYRISPTGLKKGAHFHSYLKHDWKLFSKAMLSGKAGLVYDNGAVKKNPALVGSYDVKITYPLAKNLSVDFSGKVIGPFWHHNDKRKPEIVVGSGVCINF